MRTMSRWFLVSIALVLIFSQTSFADLYLSSGQHTFWVRVENRYFKDIRNARGYASVSGTYARLEVEAPGYRRSYENVSLMPNQTTHHVRVRLEDAFTNVHVVDDKQAFIDSAYADSYSQSLYWGDEFGVRGWIPKAGFQNLQERDIDVRVNGMFAFAPRVYLSQETDRWRFEIVIKRDDMNTFSNNIRLIFPRDAAAPSTIVRARPLSELAADYAEQSDRLGTTAAADLEIVMDRLESLTRQITEGFAGLDAGEQTSLLNDLPAASPLVRHLKAVQTFSTLQK